MDHKIRNRKQSYTTYDIYNNYDKKDQIPYSTFRNIVDKLNDSILSVLQNGQNYKLLCSLGTVQIVKYKPKGYNEHSLSIDFNESKKLDKRIYHLNEHSNGYKYRLYWSKQPFSFTNRYKYQLCFTRANKRQLAQLIFNNKDYLDINDIQLYNM